MFYGVTRGVDVKAELPTLETDKLMGHALQAGEDVRTEAILELGPGIVLAGHVSGGGGDGGGGCEG